MGELFTAIIGLGIFLGLAALAGYFVVRKLRPRRGGPNESFGFTLQGLRELRDRGELTESEYERLRAEVVARVSGGVGAAGAGRGAGGVQRDLTDREAGGSAADH